jgi:hypothetical protein
VSDSTLIHNFKLHNAGTFIWFSGMLRLEYVCITDGYSSGMVPKMPAPFTTRITRGISYSVNKWLLSRAARGHVGARAQPVPEQGRIASPGVETASAQPPPMRVFRLFLSVY